MTFHIQKNSFAKLRPLVLSYSNVEGTNPTLLSIRVHCEVTRKALDLIHERCVNKVPAGRHGLLAGYEFLGSLEKVEEKCCS